MPSKQASLRKQMAALQSDSYANGAAVATGGLPVYNSSASAPAKDALLTRQRERAPVNASIAPAAILRKSWKEGHQLRQQQPMRATPPHCAPPLLQGLPSHLLRTAAAAVSMDSPPAARASCSGRHQPPLPASGWAPHDAARSRVPVPASPRVVPQASLRAGSPTVSPPCPGPHQRPFSSPSTVGATAAAKPRAPQLAQPTADGFSGAARLAGNAMLSMQRRSAGIGGSGIAAHGCLLCWP